MFAFHSRTAEEATRGERFAGGVASGRWLMGWPDGTVEILGWHQGNQGLAAGRCYNYTFNLFYLNVLYYILSFIL